jgi:serine/threonine protein kinase
MHERDLFAVADPDQREDLLKRECAGQPDLRTRIDQLLEAHFNSHPLLDQPAPDETEPIRVAHQKGIIHRDLKPTNVLDESHHGKPVPKVIDFGLAKAATGLKPSDLSSSEDPRRGLVRFLECAVLIAVGLVAFELAWQYPSSRHASSWREKDWRVWYQAHQLFRGDPEELSESELEDVRQWIRCLGLLERYPNSLTDAECELFIETLDKLSPNLHEYANVYLPVYEACRRRLADAPSGAWCSTNTREEQPPPKRRVEP